MWLRAWVLHFQRSSKFVKLDRTRFISFYFASLMPLISDSFLYLRAPTERIGPRGGCGSASVGGGEVVKRAGCPGNEGHCRQGREAFCIAREIALISESPSSRGWRLGFECIRYVCLDFHVVLWWVRLTNPVGNAAIAHARMNYCWRDILGYFIRIIVGGSFVENPFCSGFLSQWQNLMLMFPIQCNFFSIFTHHISNHSLMIKHFVSVIDPLLHVDIPRKVGLTQECVHLVTFVLTKQRTLSRTTLISQRRSLSSHACQRAVMT